MLEGKRSFAKSLGKSTHLASSILVLSISIARIPISQNNSVCISTILEDTVNSILFCEYEACVAI